ncbi:MAG: hypothetical protein IJ316_00225 [Clostridia bacterium]|nr:hypothetical protein [Clostridia bacterium]
MYTFQPENCDAPDTDEASKTSPCPVKSPKFYSLSAIITFFLLPPLWALSIPAIVFSKEAKTMYENGNIDLYERFSLCAKRFVVSAWAIFLILAITIAVLLVTIHLSLI